MIMNSCHVCQLILVRPQRQEDDCNSILAQLTNDVLILLGLPVLQCVYQDCLILLRLWNMVKDVAAWPAILPCTTVSKIMACS